MSENTDSNRSIGSRIKQGDEFRVASKCFNIDSGVYVRVEEVYEAVDGHRAVAFSHTGSGPEVDVPIRLVEDALNQEKLIRDKYDTQMHD
jgi:hypothetical protein